MIRPALYSCAVALAIAAAAPAGAATIVYTTSLSGANEVPANGSTGTGSATITVDDVANTMRVQVTFSGLSSGTTASHIHCCAPAGSNAGVATATPTFPGFPLGVTSGTYDQTFDMTQAASFNAAFITAHGGTVTQARADLFAGLAGGQAYLNVHTTKFPGGEIRGQLIAAPVPEPGAWAMLLAGFGATGLRLRRLRRAATPA